MNQCYFFEHKPQCMNNVVYIKIQTFNIDIMVGEVEDLPNHVKGFMRPKEPRLLPNNLSEVNIPTRFDYFCLGRRGKEELYEFDDN